MQEVVHGLIEEEMERMEPRDYVADRPLPTMRLNRDSIVQAELDRVAAKKPMPPLDLSRYAVEPPSGSDAEDPEKWKSAIANACAQIEHQHTRYVGAQVRASFRSKGCSLLCLAWTSCLRRLMNLELLQNLGSAPWLGSNKFLEDSNLYLHSVAEAARSESDSINAKRKGMQEEVSSKLWMLERRRVEAADKNFQIAMACRDLERDAKRLKA